MCKTLTLILALLASACSVPFYDLDAIAILGPATAVDQATQAVERLGGTVSNGHAVIFDEQTAYCGKTMTTETLAVASTMNIHLCPAYRTSSPSTQRRAVWHELGHVFGALHSTDPRDIMYPIPRVDDYTEADIGRICGSGVVRGGVCD